MLKYRIDMHPTAKSESNELLAKQEARLAKQEAQPEKQEALLNDQLDRIGAMQSLIAAKDIAIADGRRQMEALLAERDARLAGNDRLLAEQAKLIARLRSEVETLSRTIDRAEHMIAYVAQRFAAAMKRRSFRRFRHALKVRFFRLPVRTSRYSLIRNSVFFDKNYYLNSNPIVKAGKFDPVVHYLRFGGQEGRDPGPQFSEAGYRVLSPDVAATSLSALEHYESHGRNEGRRLLAPPGPIEAITASAFDPQKKTILIVSHDASRTGAPILALNLIQRFSERYNVIGLILGSGELIDHFRQASASLIVVDRIHMTDGELESVITDITSRHALAFAIANTVESRRVLKPLKVAGVPTVSLIHEFSANTRPRSAFPETISLSTRTVFSTKATLEDVVSDFWLYPSSSIHIEAQGKCVVPPSLDAAEETSIEKAWLTRSLRPKGMGHKFLVIGVGTIDLRKGVDLFLDCATIIKNELGGERFQFAWIGDDPYGESAYSFFLADQIKRAGLESQMKIVRSTSQIELAYRIADLLIIASRLDPLPNVATEALTSGLPVLCFEKTTGIANFLSENGLGEQCVAKYLDTRDLARKVRALADDDDLRAKVSERSRAAAESAFDMNAYVSKLEAIAIQAMGNESRVKEEVETILISGRFRSDFFKHAGVDSLSEDKIIEDYLDRVACGLNIRKPMPGFHPTVFSTLHASEGPPRHDPYVDFLQKGLPDGPWLQSVIHDCGQRKARTRAALHLHAFYPELVPGIIKRLNFNATSLDLFISVGTPQGAAEVRRALSGYRGRLCDLQVTPNLGRDFGPLLTQFGRELCDGYDIIGHLHTKKSVHVADRPFAEAWNTFLLENLIGGERGGAMLDAILSAMELDSGIGLVFPDDPHVISWTQNRKLAEDLASRMKLGDLPEQFNFPVGSMFWVRSSVLSRFVELKLAWADYPSEPIPIDGTMVHAIERLFGVVPATMGMRCAVTNVPGLTR
jgi:glycosyltransferase involved in cell wall biosynthesis